MILTGSASIQEEAPSLGKLVLVMRDITERPEAVANGTVGLVGTEAYEAMVTAHNPCDDGKASGRIVDVLSDSL